MFKNIKKFINLLKEPGLESGRYNENYESAKDYQKKNKCILNRRCTITVVAKYKSLDNEYSLDPIQIYGHFFYNDIYLGDRKEEKELDEEFNIQKNEKSEELAQKIEEERPFKEEGGKIYYPYKWHISYQKGYLMIHFDEEIGYQYFDKWKKIKDGEL